MAYANNIITGPVNFYDVQRALGLSSPDLATLCKSTHIKMWARFRPVEFKMAGRTGSAFKGHIPDSGSVSRVSVSFGIVNIPVWNDRVIGQMMDFWSGYSMTSTSKPAYIDEDGESSTDMMPIESYWARQLPTSAFRLTDFVSSTNPTTKGYFHKAKQPLSGLTNNTVVVTPKGLVSILYTKNEEGVSAGLTIKYEDLIAYGNTNIGNCYFGVALVKLESGSPTTTCYYVTGASMVNFQSMGAVVRGYVTAVTFAGSYMAFPFVSADALVGSAAPSSSDYHAFLSDRNTQGVYIPLMVPETLTISINYCELNISSLTAWKNTTESTRLIYYSYGLSNASVDSDVTYTFTVTQTLYDSSDNVINQTSREVSLAGQATTSVSGSIDASEYFSAAHHLAIVTTPSANQNIIFYHQKTWTTSVASSPPQRQQNNNNNETI